MGTEGEKRSSAITFLPGSCCSASPEEQQLAQSFTHWGVQKQGEGRIWVTKGNPQAEHASSVLLLVLWFSEQALISRPAFIITNNPMNTATKQQSPASVDQTARHFIRQRKFVMLCFPSESYEQTFKRDI